MSPNEFVIVDITSTAKHIIAVLKNKSRNVVIHCFTHFSKAPSFLGSIYIIIGIGAIICKYVNCTTLVPKSKQYITSIHSIKAPDNTAIIPSNFITFSASFSLDLSFIQNDSVLRLPFVDNEFKFRLTILSAFIPLESVHS